MFENWLRVKVAYRLFFKDALLGILHDEKIGFPTDPEIAYAALFELRKEEEPRLSHIITKAQWDAICHLCSLEDTEDASFKCKEPCPKKGVSRIRTFDIQTMIAMIRGLSDLPPPKGSQGWNQEFPKFGDGGRGAGVLLVKQLDEKMANLSVREVKTDEQLHELLDEMEIVLVALKYRNFGEFLKLKAMEGNMGKYYKVVLKVVIELYESIKQQFLEHEQTTEMKQERKKMNRDAIISKLEFETLKEGIEHYLEEMDQSVLGESAFEAISRINECQQFIDKKLTEIENQQQLKQKENDNVEALNEDVEQLLTCVVEGMKLHISGNIQDEDSILRRSQDLKEATKVRYSMTLDTCGNGRINPSSMKANLNIVTKQYYEKEYSSDSLSGGFTASVQSSAGKQKKFIPNEAKITNYEDLFTKRSECVVLLGNEGMGKSTIVYDLLYRWGSNQLWTSSEESCSKTDKVTFDFVFVLHFRQLIRFQQQPGITAEEILQYFYPNLPLDVLVLLKSEISCLLVLDGFDQCSAISEFKKSSNDEPSFYTKAVFDLLNPRNESIPFTRLITTHPRGLKYLANVSLIPTQEKNDKIDLKIVETYGLNAKNVNTYISDYLKDNTPPKELLDEIKDSKLLYDMMSVPSFCHGICELLEHNQMAVDKLPKTYTSLFTLILIGRIWRRQFKSASSMNGVFIKPAFKAVCQNLATAAFHTELNNKVTFELEDLPNESNIHSLLESGFIIKLNDKFDRPNSYCYQFLNRTFHEFFIALYIFTRGFCHKSERIASRSVLSILGGFCGAIIANTTADTHVQKFCKLFNNNKMTLESLLQSANGRDTSKIKTLHLFLKTLRDDPTAAKSKELNKMLSQSQSRTESETASDDSLTKSQSSDVTTTTTSPSGNYDTSPATNALILFEFGFNNLREVTLAKRVSIVGNPLKPFANEELKQIIKELSKEKRVLFLGANG